MSIIRRVQNTSKSITITINKIKECMKKIEWNLYFDVNWSWRHRLFFRNILQSNCSLLSTAWPTTTTRPSRSSTPSSTSCRQSKSPLENNFSKKKKNSIFRARLQLKKACSFSYFCSTENLCMAITTNQSRKLTAFKNLCLVVKNISESTIFLPIQGRT